jgi:CheY-like chemotaxis protein
MAALEELFLLFYPCARTLRGGKSMEDAERENDLWPIFVMVVDDEPLLRGLLADELRDVGFTVIEAAGGDEALAYMRARAHIDLVFTDVHMPGSLNGLGLAASLKTGNPYLPIIITSGQAGPDEAAELGHFIAKPYKLADAVSLVWNSLGIKPGGESS